MKRLLANALPTALLAYALALVMLAALWFVAPDHVRNVWYWLKAMVSTAWNALA